MKPVFRIVPVFVMLSMVPALSFRHERVAAEAPTFVGPTPYLSAADIPAGFFSGAYSLETFEDGSLDFGITATANGDSVYGPNSVTDSVDADDGSIDGFGTAGRSYVADGHPGVLFTFPNPLPTAAAVVWTDGAVGIGTTFEAFGPGMVSLGTIGPVILADGTYSGTTAEDRFFGVQSAAGILAIKVTHPGGQVEVDHLMFGDSGGAPPSRTCAYTFSKGSGAALVKYCLTEQGTMINLEAPSGQQHIANGEIWEGYVVCSGTVALAWDLTGTESGFGPATVLSGPSTTGVTLRRESDQFQLDQTFALDSKEKDVTITMTLKNITGAAIPDVRIARAYDPDIDNGTADDVETRSLRGVWAGGANAATLTGTLWTFATDTAVGTSTAPACSPASASAPAITGDASLANVTYRVGNVAAGARKKVTFVYRMQ